MAWYFICYYEHVKVANNYPNYQTYKWRTYLHKNYEEFETELITFVSRFTKAKYSNIQDYTIVMYWCNENSKNNLKLL